MGDDRPGLAIRILGEVTPERVAIARAADHIFISEIRAAGVYDHVSLLGYMLLVLTDCSIDR